MRAAFGNARKPGLETMGFFIFGLPGETGQTMDDTIRLAIELEPDMANFMIAAPYPGHRDVRHGAEGRAACSAATGGTSPSTTRRRVSRSAM